MPTFHFIESPRWHASISKNGSLYLTSGILAQVRSDSEFAFIIAHELAHVLLRHHHQRSPEGKSPYSLNQELQSELEADRLAFRLLAEADFNPQAGLAFLSRLNSGEESLGRIYPSLGVRLAAMQPTG